MRVVLDTNILPAEDPPAHTQDVLPGFRDFKPSRQEEACRAHPYLAGLQTIFQALLARKSFDLHHAFRCQIPQRQRHRLMHEALTAMAFGDAKTDEGIDRVDRFQVEGRTQLWPCRPRTDSTPGNWPITQVKNPSMVRPGIPESLAQAPIVLLATIFPSVPIRGFPGNAPAPVMRRCHQQRCKVPYGIRSQPPEGQYGIVHGFRCPTPRRERDRRS